MLARRTSNLSYAAFPLANLRTLPCPNRKSVDTAPLARAFEEFKGVALGIHPVSTAGREDRSRGSGGLEDAA